MCPLYISFSLFPSCRHKFHPCFVLNQFNFIAQITQEQFFKYKKVSTSRSNQFSSPTAGGWATRTSRHTFIIFMMLVISSRYDVPQSVLMTEKRRGRLCSRRTHQRTFTAVQDKFDYNNCDSSWGTGQLNGRNDQGAEWLPGQFDVEAEQEVRGTAGSWGWDKKPWTWTISSQVFISCKGRLKKIYSSCRI